jgi:ribosomal-protein-alanine N-acetyltransferase
MHYPIWYNMDLATTIRKYTPDDKEALIHLLRLNTPEYFAASEEVDLLYYLDHHASDFYVIEIGDNIVGCGGINFAEEDTIGKLSWDIFHPRYQGQGLGSKLTRFRIEKIKENPSVKSITVRTSQLAYKFYEKLGFELTKTEKDYWAPGYHMYQMCQPVG